MYIVNIWKIVVRFDDGSMDSVVDPRVYFDEPKAHEYARQIKAEGFYDDRPINEVIIYREIPDAGLGWFRTAGMTRV